MPAIQNEGRVSVGMMVEPRIAPTAPLVFIPDMQYGEMDGKPLLLDLYAPQRPIPEPRATIIWLHGFGWFAGTRRDNLEVSMCSYFASHGFLAVSIEYRLSDEAVFPAQIHDVQHAIRWVRANAEIYGADPDRIGISGASADGGLASLAGLAGDLPELDSNQSLDCSCRVQAVAIASSPSDFLQAGGEMGNDVDGPVSWLFGGRVDEKRDMMQLASPLNHVSSEAPPFLIAHGTLDETVPFGQSERLYRALISAGAIAEFHPLDGLYHNWLTEPEGVPGREDTWKLGPMALPFFDTYLRR